MTRNLKELLVEHIWLINDILERDVVSKMQADGVTAEQLQVMISISRQEGEMFTVGRAQATLHVSQPTATGIVSRLERGGFVKSRHGEDDKRVKVITLTAKGRNIVDKANKCLGRLEEVISGILTKDERAEFQALLEKIYEEVR